MRKYLESQLILIKVLICLKKIKIAKESINETTFI